MDKNILLKLIGLFPKIRLEYDEAEIVKRVSSPERKDINKTTDIDRVINAVRDKKIFYSKHPNGITINNTSKSAVQVAKLILNTVEKIKSLANNLNL
jgi:hypothetical protein